MPNDSPTVNPELQRLGGEAAAADGAAGEAAAAGAPAGGAGPDPDASSKALGFSRAFIEVMAFAAEKQYPVLHYDEAIRQKGAEKLAPVLAKYDVLNVFFLKWREEFDCGAFFAGVIWASYQKIKQHKADQAKTPASPAAGAAPGA